MGHPLSVACARPSVPRPIVFSNSHMRQLSTLMGWAIGHYASGAAFHPCQPHFRSSPALHSILSGGGRVGVLSRDMLVLDCTHDLSLTEPMSEMLQRRPSSHCKLHLSDSHYDQSLSYDELAALLQPAFSTLEEHFVRGSTQVNSNCLMVAAVSPGAEGMSRTLSCCHCSDKQVGKSLYSLPCNLLARSLLFLLCKCGTVYHRLSFKRHCAKALHKHASEPPAARRPCPLVATCPSPLHLCLPRMASCASLSRAALERVVLLSLCDGQL